jgi:hypothetical protein
MFGRRGPAWGRAASVGRVVRAAQNPSGWGVRNGAGAGRGEHRPDTGLAPDVWALVVPFLYTCACYTHNHSFGHAHPYLVAEPERLQ